LIPPYIKKVKYYQPIKAANKQARSQPIPLPLCPKPTRNKGNDMIKQIDQRKRGTRVRETKSPKKKTAKIFKGTFREMFTQGSKNFS
jgi:hypothetical protein